MNLPTVQMLGPELMKLLSIPAHCLSFELRCAVDEIVSVKCEFHPRGDAGMAAAIGAVLAEYELVRREAPVGAPAQSLDYSAWARDLDASMQGMPYDAWVCSRAGVAHAVEAIGFDAWMHQRTEAAHGEFMARTSRMIEIDRQMIFGRIYAVAVRPWILGMAKSIRDFPGTRSSSAQ